jgi:hypothetical protein
MYSFIPMERTGTYPTYDWQGKHKTEYFAVISSAIIINNVGNK